MFIMVTGVSQMRAFYSSLLLFSLLSMLNACQATPTTPFRAPQNTPTAFAADDQPVSLTPLPVTTPRPSPTPSSPASSEEIPTPVKELQEIWVNQDTFYLGINDAAYLQAELIYADGSSSVDVFWTSHNEDKVIIDGTGRLLRIAAGEALITVRAERSAAVEKRVRVLDIDAVPQTEQQQDAQTDDQNNQNHANQDDNIEDSNEKNDPAQNENTQTPEQQQHEQQGEQNEEPVQQESLPPPQAPIAPTNLTASNLTSNSVQLNWGSVSGASSYSVYLNQVSISTGLTSSFYTYSNLTPGNNHAFEVSAVNAQGESAKTVLNVMAPTPAPPPNNYTNPLGMAFKGIHAGSFTRGSYEVTLTSGFLMQTTEVTQGQWEAVMGTGNWPGKNSTPPRVPSEYYGKGAQYPMYFASWCDIVGAEGDPTFCSDYSDSFLKRLNSQGHGIYRLPTDAEWEYAARAATTTNYACGNGVSSFNNGENANTCPFNMGWYWQNNEHPLDNSWTPFGIQPVAGKLPNAWGLYDMHGNALEWVQDRTGAYPAQNVTDPTGPETGINRVLRGGSWRGNFLEATSTSRTGMQPWGSNSDTGFRLVRQTW